MKNTAEEMVYSDQNLEELIRHNIGVMEKKPSDSSSIHMIEKFGKNSLLSPILLNYLFVIESDYFS